MMFGTRSCAVSNRRVPGELPATVAGADKLTQRRLYSKLERFSVVMESDSGETDYRPMSGG